MTTSSFVQMAWDFSYTQCDYTVKYSDHAGLAVPNSFPWQVDFIAGQSAQPDLFSWMAAPLDDSGISQPPGGMPSSSPEPGANSPHPRAKSPEPGLKSPELGPKSPELLLTEDDLTPELRLELEEITFPIRSGQARGDLAAVDTAILQLCQGRFLGRHLLGKLLDRNPDDLMRRNLRKLVFVGKLSTAFSSSRHPRQAYTTATPQEPTP